MADRLGTRYVLVIRSEENFAEKTTFSFNYAKLAVVLGSVFVVSVFVALFLAQTLLARWFDPSYENRANMKRIAALSGEVDSLMWAVESKQEFIENLTSVMSGEVRNEDSIRRENGLTEDQPRSVAESVQDADRRLRAEFNDVEIEDLNNSDVSYSELQQLFFFKPTEGTISSPYNAKEAHYGVDVVAKENETVKSVADGTVVMAAWTQDTGNVVIIQHQDNLMSVYKHTAEVFVKAGDFVSGGKVIAIVGNTGELTTGPHLHFEMWYNGSPMNPQEFLRY
ncbi:peptidase M23 [Fulvitalea axinellae]|uniref:Peptidase M23 n=1 Tax=Fulvitalea axinellae TaxID=1182444 RepID=A0AAU9CKG6_9BACT|nr:peptidase M23 [Fulvitalea axinellae]